MHRNRIARAGVFALALALLTAACSTSDTNESTAGTTPGTGAATGACGPSSSSTPTADPVGGSASDRDLTSFDGTRIRLHWFPVPGAGGDTPAPTVLMGPGWSLPGDTNVDTVGVLGAINIKTLRDAGFNVLTWDPRGFGASSGLASVNDPNLEGRDVQLLIDWVAAQPGVQLDRTGDPRMGMVGGSYGGGIQFTVASQDCRVDAIVPIIAWNSLKTSLYKADTVKAGWAGLLTNVAKTGKVDPHVTAAYQEGMATGTLSKENYDWFVSRGPGDAVGRIRVPTLIIQGTVDGLFTLDEAAANYALLEGAGTTVSMLWFCGGHGVCLTDQGDTTRVSRAALAWLKRYVQGDTSADTGARIDLLDQNGRTYTADDYPLPTGTPVTANGSGTLTLSAEGGSGPATTAPGGEPQLVGSLALPVTPARATNAVDVAVDTGATPSVIVGPPQLELSYSGTSPDGDKPTRVFAQLVDDSTGVVLGNQITPIDVTLDGGSHTVTVPLETVIFAATPGSRLTLQLVATTVAYAQPRLGGTVTFDRIALSLPVAAGLTPQG